MNNKKSKAYLVGGGIASLSAAVYLINDGKFKGENITIFGEAKKMGGSLDAQKVEHEKGYAVRGVRFCEEKAFSCTFDLMSQIPSLITPGKTLREEFVDFNKKNKSYSESRLFKKGNLVESHFSGLKLKNKFKLTALFFRRENTLDNLEIRDYFTPSFFESDFWYNFCTVFAFQSWHSLAEFRRYLLRSIHVVQYLDTLDPVEITPLNQYESLVLPIIEWLKKQGVKFETETGITDIDFKTVKNKKMANRIRSVHKGKEEEIIIGKNNYVFTTLGSMVANSSIGSMTEAPILNYKDKNLAWSLWENISKENPEFGKPEVFNSFVDKSKWTSFTITFKDPTFFVLMKKYINERVTSHGVVTLVDSNWFATIVLFYRPYFLNQPDNITLSWGYGLYPDKKGNFVKKKMLECTGEEILTELIYHLKSEKHLDTILESAVCIPCMTPYVTSQLLPRKKGDRPEVVPKNSANFAFLGQYCEIPNDVVFTVEYSVRSAQTAVYNLLKLDKKPSPIYKGTHNVKVLYNAFKTIIS
ncbi:oleate hydratase [Patescibacteria group bacterium]|nr:oleate hydratase [Patescibacteria group bacterium]